MGINFHIRHGSEAICSQSATCGTRRARAARVTFSWIGDVLWNLDRPLCRRYSTPTRTGRGLCSLNPKRSYRSWWLVSTMVGVLGGSSPDVSESPVLKVFHNFDPPCRRERRDGDY